MRGEERRGEERTEQSSSIFQRGLKSVHDVKGHTRASGSDAYELTKRISDQNVFREGACELSESESQRVRVRDSDSDSQSQRFRESELESESQS
ncbi:hypothetical protein QTP70_010097 [Hemibagrus guttatus]|uniref:Uncharacterized protein n=1 Tax=Hemibagrus guttatus TaxID=175788 RepID=A0AAE0R2I1_9TELE|nr:hypothetical protein QTP70_010097 [Hemibagrus guttatus]